MTATPFILALCLALTAACTVGRAPRSVGAPVCRSATSKATIQWGEFRALVASKDRRACTQLVGFKGDWVDCQSTLAPGKTAGIVHLIEQCNGERCLVHWWYVSPKLGVVKLPDHDGRGGSLGGGTTAFTPAGDELITDLLTLASPLELGSWVVRLVRVTPQTGKVTAFADCMSPTLAPDGLSYACRNRRGDLLRVAGNGGKPRLVARSGVKKAEVDWVPYRWIFPEAARFNGDIAEFHIDHPMAATIVRRTRWRQASR